jgi:hypothetical protein
MMSVLLLTFTVSSGFVSNAYHKAYARGNLDALGTKIRESINNQITEELSGSSGPSPTNSTSPIPTTLSLTLYSSPPNIINFQGYLKAADTGSGISGAEITLCTTVLQCTLVAKNQAQPLARCFTIGGGYYASFPEPVSPECHVFTTVQLIGSPSVTAQYLGVPGTPEVTIPATPGIAPSATTQPVVVPPS